MSKNNPNLPPVDSETKAAKRAAAAQALREQKVRARRRAIIVQVGVGTLVAVLVLGLIAFALSRGGADENAAAPAGLTADSGVLFGAADAQVKVVVVEDFQCPACQFFEEQAGEVLSALKDDPEVSVEYRPIAFLDRASTTDYSSRAANAAACVLDDSGPDAWLAMHDTLYAEQPPEGGEGLPDSDLIGFASDAGAGDVSTCIEDKAFGPWVELATERTTEGDFTGTPAVFVNGTPLASNDPAALQAAVDAARG